jgi:NitT/TauT family transport system ATP-binding protein
MNTPGVDFTNVSLWFRGAGVRDSLHVLDSISFTVAPSEFVALVGPSGCGKTSLLRLAGGLLDQRTSTAVISGTVHVVGMTPSQAKKARMFGFAFQNPVLLPWRTVAGNVQLPLEIGGQVDADTPSRIGSLLELMEVSEFANARPDELSGGMQQRVNIARALVHEPQILLLDEPFGALDELTRERLNLALLRMHRLKRQTVLLVTHSLREAAFLADRIVVLSLRPAHMKAVVDSPLPHERSEDTQMERPFLDLVARLKDTLGREGNSP